MIFLDTNIVLWLASGNTSIFSKKVEKKLNEAKVLLISPMVKLELQYLREIKRINKAPEQIIHHLRPIGLAVQEIDMLALTDAAMSMSWTRDPFDRLITAQAAMHELPLVTKNQHIRKYYSLAVW